MKSFWLLTGSPLCLSFFPNRRKTLLPFSLLLLHALAARWALAETGSQSPDPVIDAYVRAVGGSASIARINTREVHAQRHHGSKLVYYWQKPNKVLLVEGKKKMGYDGGSGWILSSKKRVSKLPKGSQIPLEMDADPVRYARLKQLYPEVLAAPPETLDERRMNVLISPNTLGATKFYFDSSSHLLVRVEETGETSAYFKHVTDFSDYQEVDGVKLPFRIVHNSTEPGGKEEEIRISKVMQNVPLQPQLFAKPSGATVVLGGKR